MIQKCVCMGLKLKGQVPLHSSCHTPKHSVMLLHNNPTHKQDAGSEGTDRRNVINLLDMRESKDETA